MKALVIIHQPGRSPDFVGERLRTHGFTLDEVLITKDINSPEGVFPDIKPEDYDLIVVLGSTYTVYEKEEISSWIYSEIDFLKQADAKGIPIFAICFGSQVLAEALGGTTEKASESQIGWYSLKANSSSPIQDGPWFQWHSDRFVPPPGSIVHVSDDVCDQVFTLRKNIGIQYHPEMSLKQLQDWLKVTSKSYLTSESLDPQVMCTEMIAHESDARERCNRLVDWYLKEIAEIN